MELNEIKNRLNALYEYNPKKGLNDELLPEQRVLYDDMVLEFAKHHIYETHGYVNNVSNYLETIYQWVEEACNNHTSDIIRKNGYNLVIPPDAFDNIENKPFDVLTVYVNIKLTPDESEVGGYYDNGNGGVINGKSYASVHLTLRGVSLQAFREQIYTILGHEFIHGYEGNMRVIDNRNAIGGYNVNDNPYSLIGHTDRSNYSRMTALMRNYPKQFLFYFLYATDRVEINAYIGQIKSELDQLTQVYDSPHDYLEAATKTDGYSRIPNLERFIHYVNHLFADCPESDETNDIIEAYMAVFPDEKLTTYKKLFEKLYNRYKRFEDQARKQIPKMAYDVYYEKHKPENTKYEVPLPQTDKIGHPKPGDDLD